VLVREVEGFEREVRLFPDDESLWRTAPGVTNAAGTLALHLAGNLQHYIGAVLGGSGYVRDRAAEFNRRNVPRDAVLAELAAARRIVRETLPALPPARLDEPYPGDLGALRMPTGRFLLHLCAHAALHLGQAGYLRRMLTGSSESAGPLPIKDLDDGVRPI
jgi:DinB superfamily